MKKKTKKRTPKQTVQDIIRQEVEKKIPDLPRFINQRIEAAILSLIGINRSYGRAEIDHRNGRNSALTEAFKAYAAEEAAKIARSYKMPTSELSAMKAVFAREFERELRYKLTAVAKERANAELTKFTDGIEVDVAKILEGTE